MDRFFKSMSLIGATIILVTLGASDNGYPDFTRLLITGLIGSLMLIVGLKGSKIMR